MEFLGAFRRPVSPHVVTRPELGRERIPRGAHVAVERARAIGASVLFSVSVPAPLVDPLAYFQHTPDARRYYWSRPDLGNAMSGSGAAFTLDVDEGDWSEPAASSLRRIASSAVIESDRSVSPRIFLGLAFADQSPGDIWSEFPRASFSIPEILVIREGGRRSVIASRMVEGDADPDDVAASMERTVEERTLVAERTRNRVLPTLKDHQEEFPSEARWGNQIDQILEEIKRGLYEKVVLVRRTDLEFDEQLDPAVVLERLADRYPASTAFAFGWEKDCFLGASPETLVQVTDGTAHVLCLAGSAVRGANESEDLEEIEGLLSSTKNLAEHQFVVQFVRDRLGPLSVETATQPNPSILTLPNLHHLSTPVTSRLKPDASFLDVVSALHPTPAVAGTPRAAALEAIERIEMKPRGWFAGAGGWLDLDGNGEMVVTIRSGLLRGRTAHLFAGCGIVAGSNPQSEWIETETKLLPMRQALDSKG